MNARTVEVRLKADGYGECGCGCGREGRLKKPWRSNGVRCVANVCGCRQCIGGRQSGKERVRNNKIAKKVGGSREPMSGNLSGIDGRSGFWEWEETANVTLVRGFRSWIGSKQIEAKLRRLMARTGSRRVFILTWDGKPRWCVMPYEDWANQAVEDSEAS